MLRIQPVPDSKKVDEIKNYWSYGFHDNDYGIITDMDLSFNEKFLFSVGADSNIFGILFNCSDEELEKAKLDSIKLTVAVSLILF